LITIKGVEMQKNCFEQELSNGYKEMAQDLPRELEAQLWTNSYLLNGTFLAAVKRVTVDNRDFSEKFVCELLIVLAEAKN
jgi:hypothetical protein